MAEAHWRDVLEGHGSWGQKIFLLTLTCNLAGAIKRGNIHVVHCPDTVHKHVVGLGTLQHKLRIILEWGRGYNNDWSGDGVVTLTGVGKGLQKGLEEVRYGIHPPERMDEAGFRYVNLAAT